MIVYDVHVCDNGKVYGRRYSSSLSPNYRSSVIIRQWLLVAMRHDGTKFNAFGLVRPGLETATSRLRGERSIHSATQPDFVLVSFTAL